MKSDLLRRTGQPVCDVDRDRLLIATRKVPAPLHTAKKVKVPVITRTTRLLYTHISHVFGEANLSQSSSCLLVFKQRVNTILIVITAAS